MLAVTSYDVARVSSALRSALGWPFKLIARLCRRRADRIEYRRMLHMSEHSLSDIGLTRDDIRAALSEPVRWDELR